MADVTNNTNRYGLKLLEINGITALGSIFPVAFCLIPSEDTNAFTWCFIQLREWLQSKARLRGEADGNAFIPHVIITDYDAAARAALSATFPDSQLQVCTWHIMKNITTNAKKRWLGDYDDDDPFDPPQEPQDDEDPGALQLPEPLPEKEAPVPSQQPSGP
ncbi:MULE transposase [Hirsutella rhossiliensis]|uniref:MULE transposase domain-containing protein n=1 Tax=Hirsutella rhossiliensis TaxID=111463 RepID=A0A9P8N145_9HYPO|nr:MULE transposase domain-containing protein [Hirsutella rhossiliensis]KAH0964929.1 MULE transposase domain-containing protein [Hirsutella rhossiliensis]